jgi:hypothetical protein
LLRDNKERNEQKQGIRQKTKQELMPKRKEKDDDDDKKQSKNIRMRNEGGGR